MRWRRYKTWQFVGAASHAARKKRHEMAPLQDMAICRGRGGKLHVQIVGEGGVGHQKFIPGFSALAHEIAEGEVGVEFILKLDFEEPARGGIECRLHP